VSRRLLGLLTCLVLLAAAPALAAGQAQKPSAKELWKAYPLHPSAQATPAPARPAATAASAAEAGASAAEAGGGGGGVPVVLIAALACAVAGGVALLVWLRTRGPGPRLRWPELLPTGLVPLAAGGLQDAEIAAMAAEAADVLPADGPAVLDLTIAQARRRPAGAGGRQGAGRAARRRPGPPDPRRAWTAEIQWRHASAGSSFWVIAEAADGSARAPIARSGALEWPPTSPGGVEALSAAAGALENALLAAGWRPLPPGAAWYAKRFGWDPAAVATARQAPAGSPEATRPRGAAPAAPTPPREPSGRFKRDAPAWPDDARERWRCEIKWDAGYMSSRFQAVAYPPGGGQNGRPVGASSPFKWTFRGEPDPRGARYMAEARGLAAGVAAAGWEPAGRGDAWYAERFVWRGDGEPPERVEPAPDAAEPAQ
jgi:hypothetical protein